jgi:DASS family divalent anion:Na+ symporter
MNASMTSMARGWEKAAPAVPFVAAIALWFAPIPDGVTHEAWHLFAIFASAIFAIIIGAYPLLTAALIAGAAAVLTGTVEAAKVFAGFSNSSVLLVVVAFLVATAVVKCGLGRRISLRVVSVFGHSTLGLGYSIFITDALIAPGFPSNTSRSGVLFPIINSLAQDSGSQPDDPATRKLGGYLMFCGMASLGISSALWMTATSANPVALSLVAPHGLSVDFGKWLLVSSVPSLTVIATLPWLLYRLFPPGVTDTPQAPAAAREALRQMGPMTRDEKVTGIIFVLMISAWIMAGALGLNLTAIAIAGLGALLASRVLTMDDIYLQGSTLATFLWLAVLFALSGQLNEMGFMSYVGERLAVLLGDLAWPVAYVVLLGLYVLMHYMFVSQSAHVLALLTVFLGVGVQAGVPLHLMGFSLLFASSYFSVLTPQGGSQNIIFAASGYLQQGELYRLGLITVGFSTMVFLLVGTPWILFVGG